ncbi:hypothetical protein ISCGN_024550 [Ixodes scapularis]
MAGRPLKTVNRIIQAYRDDERRIKDSPHPRRPRATTVEDDHHIVAAISLDPFQSTRDIKEALDLDVSEMTIRRRFAEAGSKSRMSAQTPLLTGTNKAQRYDPQFIQHVAASGRTMVNVWGALSKDGLRPLFRIERSLTSQIYYEVIDYVMLPYVLDGPFPDVDFTYQHDLSPVHTSGMVRSLLEERCVTELPWAPQGANLNIIEDVWGRMKAAMDHFEPSQFQTRCSDGWRRLKATAVPSLFLHSESQQPAARTSGATLQVGLLTQPLPTTSGACFVSIFQGPAYPRAAIPPRSSPQVTSDNQRGQASSAARGTLVSADSTSWQPAARTSGAVLQGGLLTQPLPTTSGACFVSIFQGPAYPRVAIPPHPSLQVTSDNQRGQASAAALGTLVSAASTSWMSRKIKQLENENHRLVRQAALQKTREATFRSHLHKFFTADQLAALSRSSNRGSRWSNAADAICVWQLGLRLATGGELPIAVV